MRTEISISLRFLRNVFFYYLLYFRYAWVKVLKIHVNKCLIMLVAVVSLKHPQHEQPATTKKVREKANSNEVGR